MEAADQLRPPSQTSPRSTAGSQTPSRGHGTYESRWSALTSFVGFANRQRVSSDDLAFQLSIMPQHVAHTLIRVAYTEPIGRLAAAEFAADA